MTSRANAASSMRLRMGSRCGRATRTLEKKRSEGVLNDGAQRKHGAERLQVGQERVVGVTGTKNCKCGA